MSAKFVYYTLAVLVIVVSLSCQLGGAASEDQPAESRDTPTQAPPTSEPIDLQATADVRRTAEALATANEQATANAAVMATQEFQKTQQAMNKEATATQAKSVRLTSTAESMIHATAQAQPLLAMLEQLKAQGYIESTAGVYFPLPAFDESHAKMGYGIYWRTGLAAENFALTAHAKLMSASDNADWRKASCGVIFGEEDEDNYNLVDIAMDGFLYSWDVRNDNFRAIAYKNYGPPMAPEGEADILLVVLGQHYHVFVNGQETLSATNLRLMPGNIALLMRSGSNKGYGTRCIMDQLGVWIFD
jgi:murein L,D-transpeptidase YcbB/YkuD